METAAEALDYIITVAQPKVADQTSRHQDYISNLDQTAIPLLTYNAKKTLEVVGRRSVHIKKSTNDTMRATFAMTVTASGKILIFKGTPNGQIVRNEFPGYTSDMIYYACQGNAWMMKK